MAAQADERRLATVLAIDVVGYSAAAERDQVATMRRIAALRARIMALADEHGGRLFHTAGDGFLLEFPLASAAVRAALALLAEITAPESGLPAVRAGAHLGEVIAEGEDLLGHGVNVAARLAAQAEPNALVISDTIKTQLHGEIDAEFAPLGAVHLSKMRVPVMAHMHVAAASGLRVGLIAFIRRHRRSLAAGAGVAAAIALGMIAFAARPQGYVLGELELVAQSSRHELQPSLSPDGRFIVYAAETGPEIYTNVDIFMRSVAGGEETPLAAESGFHEFAPAVSPSGTRLAYVRQVPFHLREPGKAYSAHIMVRILPNGLDREVGKSGIIGPSHRISWTPDERGLVYMERTPDEQSMRLRILDLQTGVARDLVPPLEGGNGDYNVTVSPDGARVAFVRYRANEDGDVYVYNIRNRRLTRITDGVQWAQVAWADSRNLFVTLRGEAGTELWSKPASGGNGQRLLPALRTFSRLDAAPGLIALEVGTRVINLWRGQGAAAAAITSGNQSDTDADFSRDGTLAYISSQAAPWLYLQAPGQPPRRFVELTGEHPRGLRWSPDGRQLVYVALIRERYRLFLVDAASGVIEEVPTSTDASLYSPSWAPNGRSLICSGQDERGWRLLRVDPYGSASPRAISDYGWVEGVETVEGLFAVRVAGRGGVWRLAPGQPPELVLDMLWPTDRGYPTRHWTVADGRIYAADRVSGHTRVLSRAVAGGPVTRALDVEARYGGSLAVDPRTGAIIFGVVVDEQSDIGLIRFRRR